MYRQLRAAPSLLLHLARGRPVGYRWGYDRGTPVDRYYIERFLGEHRADITGRVLEVKSDDYACRFGGGVTHVDVLDVDAGNRQATIVADLASADALADESYDCFVLTQTLQYIFDVGAALRHAARILRPGGVLLATVPSVTRMTTEIAGLHDYWRFTEASCTELVRDAFDGDDPLVRAYGNVLACTAFLAGLAAEELPRSRLELHDPTFPLIVTVRAVKV
jgi:SAM-dependent methyltransferase